MRKKQEMKHTLDTINDKVDTAEGKIRELNNRKHTK